MRRKSAVRLLLSLSFLASACGAGADSSAVGADDASSDRPSVVTAFYPLQWAAEQVGGDAVTVSSLTPPGSEPHDLTLDAKSIERLRSADVVVYLGNDFQPEVQKAIDQLPASVRRVDALHVPGVDLLPLPDDAESTTSSTHDHEEYDAYDPHVWLDPTRMQAIANAIRATLLEVDASRSELFATNLARVKGNLDALQRATLTKLATCKQRTIVTSHAAFQYYSARYDLTQLPIAGISPDVDPDPKTLQHIAEAAKMAGVSTVYFEDALPSKLSDTVAREIGAKTDLLSALEFQPEHNGDYLSVQTENADRLAKGLDCSS